MKLFGLALYMENYEQKYKDALRRAKKLYGEGTITECLGWVFPELEDEDERIKREILELVSISSNGNQFEEIKDWLEKQGRILDPDKVIEWLKALQCNRLRYAYFHHTRQQPNI